MGYNIQTHPTYDLRLFTTLYLCILQLYIYTYIILISYHLIPYQTRIASVGLYETIKSCVHNMYY